MRWYSHSMWYYSNPFTFVESHKSNHNLLYMEIYFSDFSMICYKITFIKIIEPQCEKDGLRGVRKGVTQTGLYIHGNRLETYIEVLSVSQNKGVDG